MDVGQIVELIQNFKDEENFKLDFFAYGQLHIERLKATGRIQNATMYGTALSALRRFIGRDNLDIREITSKFVGRFIDFLIQEPPRPGHKKGRRAPSLYFRRYKPCIMQLKGNITMKIWGLSAFNSRRSQR